MNEILDDFLMHYGTPRHSGRYPWGSGENPHQRTKSFLSDVDDMRRQGMSDTEIARGMGITTTKLRAMRAIAVNEARAANVAEAYRLKERGMSNMAIARQMGINESSVRSLLNPSAKERNDILTNTAEMLRSEVGSKGMIDVSTGTERYIDVSETRLKTALAMLEEEGYKTHVVQVPQQFGAGKTYMKVLAPPGTEYKDIVSDLTQVKLMGVTTDDGGRTYEPKLPPKPIDSKRVAVRYAEDGGADADGVMYIRPGVEDIALGGKRYAQVRVAVDGTHYLKGMAMYKDDLPDGVDILFNTNKSNTGNKLDAMKAVKDDPEHPFGSLVRQHHYIDKNGKRQQSVMNIVNEEGDWDQWSRTLSSQMLSKQSRSLVKQQLDIAYSRRQAEFDEIMSLTNPAVKKKLLETFSDGADSAAVHLKAAALPRQRSQVILPINSLKDTEIYAPNYKHGEKVVLIRFPHGGIFEIPELTVNNRHPDAKKSLGQAIDAVGINSKVAQRLSGADFDGDSVLVIPNNNRAVKTSAPLKGLKGFDPQSAYPAYEGMAKMKPRTKQKEMGVISNLITDMTIKGATESELARAVRHSMVVIDAEKHNLNWKQSAKDNGISQLKAKYQVKPDGTVGGTATLVSRASSQARVPDRKLRSAKDGGPIDPVTGKRVYVETGAGYTNSKGRFIPKRTISTKMAETDDARTLSSGQPVEELYADYANRLKSMANRARREHYAIKPAPVSSSAKKVYAQEVATLNAKLNTALKNAPLERQAQVIANAAVSAKLKANPDLERSEIRKVKARELETARNRTGAKKAQIEPTEREWEAIQAGAISNNQLTKILNNANLDKIKALATPRTPTGVSTAVAARMRSMYDRGYTQAEIAEALGISASAVNTELRGEG